MKYQSVWHCAKCDADFGIFTVGHSYVCSACGHQGPLREMRQSPEKFGKWIRGELERQERKPRLLPYRGPVYIALAFKLIAAYHAWMARPTERLRRRITKLEAELMKT